MLVLVEHLPHFVPSLTRCDIQLECCHCRDRGTNENSPNFHSSNFIQVLIFFRPSSFQSCSVWRVRLVNIYILITVIKSHEKLRLNSPFLTHFYKIFFWLQFRSTAQGHGLSGSDNTCSIWQGDKFFVGFGLYMRLVQMCKNRISPALFRVIRDSSNLSVQWIPARLSFMWTNRN